jgi:hypothetical protein
MPWTSGILVKQEQQHITTTVACVVVHFLNIDSFGANLEACFCSGHSQARRFPGAQ